ncbi:lysophosphatidic acid receptor 5 [Gallus gallus]|uniref:Lysophosphatidic acid receptor 5 n=1 Tax=Gallus gallus TaxID=9031 RepID=A0A8V0ZDJ0_CHICK|nr:lysophosphatidic acid receptor 5 [Gallus gallus]XP_040504525.1 lysophosphatidic acid receptor 5 [Gallus gallus]XP_040517508.1 lysophosphatidic acid receptor 5 [Gallus gallus]XP_040517510.1 lysophosphatidic acid receptor 5 [Gallus gallus]XP_046764899.1 lysophosphatidic acid receptor 5 [Gallus gallus]XP_046800398.1 lysophosphatidic acid receptor 5 [Gallus gallus]
MSAANVSQPCKDYSFYHKLLLPGYILIFITGLTLNVMALWIFVRYLRLKSVVMIYMFNLAVSDLTFTLPLPLRLYYYFNHEWPFGNTLCQVSGSVFQINMYGSCIFLMCINLDRYIAIVHPLRWRHLRRPKVARLLCLVVWVVILMGSIPTAIVHKQNHCESQNQTTYLCFESFSDNMWQKNLFPLVVLAEILGFLLPLSAVTYCSIQIFRELCQTRQPKTLRQQKTVRLLLVNLVIFVIFFVPYNTTLAVYGLIKARVIDVEKQMQASVREVLIVTMMLASMNCTLDPLIYYFSTEGFRNTFKKLRRGQTWHSDTGVIRNQVVEQKSTRNHAASTAKQLPSENFHCPGEAVPALPTTVFLNGPIEDSEI